MKRTFERVSLEHDGIRRPGYRVTCSECPAKEEIVASKNAGGLPPEVVVQKFSQKGWTVAGNGSHDVCPACNRNRLMARRGNVVNLVKPNAEKPREMSREDKRLIFGKIDAVYLDERRGYENGWSDKRVAEDLGVPLAWVRGVRESDFGPEGLSADSREAVALARQIGSDLASLETKLSALTKEFADIKTRYARTERSVDEIRKLTVA